MKFINEYLNRQLAHPQGFVGRQLARQWNQSRANQICNAWGVDLLELNQDDQVLEVGFGTGSALQRIARQVPLGSLAGIDHSSLMVKMASERLQAYKQDLPLALITAGIEECPNLEQKFSRVLSVNALMYWHNKELCLRRIKSLMLPDAKIVILHQPPEPKATEESTRRAGRGIARLLELTGFQEVRSAIKLQIEPVPAVAVWGYN